MSMNNLLEGECQDCHKLMPEAELSGLGTCPDCVKNWIKEYKSYHDKRYGKREKVRNG